MNFSPRPFVNWKHNWRQVTEITGPDVGRDEVMSETISEYFEFWDHIKITFNKKKNRYHFQFLTLHIILY